MPPLPLSLPLSIRCLVQLPFSPPRKMAATEQFGKLNDGHFFLPPPPSLGVCAAVGFWPFSAAVHLKSRFAVWFGIGWTMAVMIVMMLSPGGSEERENFRPDDDRREEGPSLAAPWRMDVLAIQTFPP